MNNKIEETIKYFKHYVVYNLSLDAQYDFQKILDYITNLQEQLHQASLDIQELIEKDINCPSYCDKLEIYKSRCDKALEINKKLQNISILDSSVVLWLSQQENILCGDD